MPTEDVLTPVAVEDILEGAMVDLEGDQYADPNSDNPLYPYEYVKVIGNERETEECFRLDFSDGASVGFPINYQLKVWKE